MISSLLHLVGLRPRVYYTLANFRGWGKAPLPPHNTPMRQVINNNSGTSRICQKVSNTLLEPVHQSNFYSIQRNLNKLLEPSKNEMCHFIGIAMVMSIVTILWDDRKLVAYTYSEGNWRPGANFNFAARHAPPQNSLKNNEMSSIPLNH